MTDYTELKSRLRNGIDFDDSKEAADVIESLERQIAELSKDAVPEGSAPDDLDTKRLDFLDHNLKFKMGWKVGQAPAGNLSVSSVIMGGKDIRSAIDDVYRLAAAPKQEK